MENVISREREREKEKYKYQWHYLWIDANALKACTFGVVKLMNDIHMSWITFSHNHDLVSIAY